jgi:hypothetical protein
MYKGLTGEYVAFVEGGYTICSQPDREKADRCLEYYKSQNPTAELHTGLGKMIERNLTYELLYTYYEDRERGEDIETIDYRSLIHIITELMSRIEQLEKVNKENLSLLNLVEKGLNE